MADAQDIDKRRRDLYAISLALIVYNLSNGTIPGGATTTLFGSVEIHRPIVLLAGAWISWLYFLWQFWLVAKPVTADFQKDVDVEVMRSKEYRNFCTRVLRQIANVAARPADVPDWQALNMTNMREGIINRATEAANVGRVFPIEAGTQSKRFSRHEVCSITPEGMETPRPLADIPESVWKKLLQEDDWQERRRRTWLVANARAAYRLHAFSNRVLPLICAAFAPLILLARSCWNLWH